jgi:hypothetical protein
MPQTARSAPLKETDLLLERSKRPLLLLVVFLLLLYHLRAGHLQPRCRSGNRA